VLLGMTSGSFLPEERKGGVWEDSKVRVTTTFRQRKREITLIENRLFGLRFERELDGRQWTRWYDPGIEVQGTRKMPGRETAVGWVVKRKKTTKKKSRLCYKTLEFSKKYCAKGVEGGPGEKSMKKGGALWDVCGHNWSKENRTPERRK